jgi:hypothetical protein
VTKVSAGFCQKLRQLGFLATYDSSGGGSGARRCPACGSRSVRERPERTTQGYRRFRCRCGKPFNERSAGALNKGSIRAMSSPSWCSGDCVTS